MTNISLSFKLIEALVEQGLRHFIVCAGARNAPLVSALEKVHGLYVEHYFEERAAAFYGLGLAKSGVGPVAVLTTSGTAVAELYPAIMEAHYSGQPLIALTADRPESYRGSGAPQSVNQTGLFGEHVAQNYDLSVGHYEKPQLFSDRPLHINICFDEPLIDAKIEPRKLSVSKTELTSGFQNADWALPLVGKSFRRPLFILGSLKASQKLFVKSCLLELGLPIYAEAHSGLREDADLQEQMIQSGEQSIASNVFMDHFDSVIRIGGVPTLRLWRDLESKLSHMPVASFSELPFSGLSRTSQVAPIEELPEFLRQLVTEASDFSEEPALARLNEAKKTCPSSEVSLLAAWTEALPTDVNVFIGNSLPIREWELAKSFESKELNIYTNRGVNGIDGLIATACGVARGTGKKTFVVLGDLSTLYDLSSLALVSKMKSLVKLVVINNGGGMIFRQIFNDPSFENRHDWSFSKAGEMFGLSYAEASGSHQDQDILEIKPNSEQSKKFWSIYRGTHP